LTLSDFHKNKKLYCHFVSSFDENQVILDGKRVFKNDFCGAVLPIGTFQKCVMVNPAQA